MPAHNVFTCVSNAINEKVREVRSKCSNLSDMDDDFVCPVIDGRYPRKWEREEVTGEGEVR